MIFVDSSVWIAYFNGVDSAQTNALDAALGTTRVVVGDLVLTEVLQGFRDDADFRTARALMLHLDVRAVLSMDPVLRAAEHYRFLRNKGIPFARRWIRSSLRSASKKGCPCCTTTGIFALRATSRTSAGSYCLSRAD